MDAKNFLHAYELINTNLVNEIMSRTFNSIGSNIFLEFGREQEVIFTNGRKSVQKEWALWVSYASWRITKNNKYFVGSGENLDINIQSHLEKLLGKRFQSFRIISQFLDAEFNFEDGYQLMTFFNWSNENQWTFFFPDRTTIEVDCSSPEAIKHVQDIAERVPIIETYKKIEFPKQDVVVIEITYDKRGLPTFHFGNETSINLENCTWRLEKNKNYLVGCLDDDKINSSISELIGKKLKQIDVANSMMDARFQFEDQYVLKTFSCCRIANQWRICSKGSPIFHASVQIIEIRD